MVAETLEVMEQMAFGPSEARSAAVPTSTAHGNVPRFAVNEEINGTANVMSNWLASLLATKQETVDG